MPQMFFQPRQIISYNKWRHCQERQTLACPCIHRLIQECKSLCGEHRKEKEKSGRSKYGDSDNEWIYLQETQIVQDEVNVNEGETVSELGGRNCQILAHTCPLISLNYLPKYY